MQLIESKTLGSAQASIEFTNIPNTYTDLYLLCSLRSDSVNTAAVKIFPNSSSSNLSSRILYGSGSSAASTSTSSDYVIIGGTNPNVSTANTFSNMFVYFPNYTSSSAKSFSIDAVSENNATEAYQGIAAALKNETTAITSIQIYANSGNLAQYSSASLYGITKGSDGTTTVS